MVTKPKPRPDDIPVGNVKRQSGAITESIRPKTLQKRPRDLAKEFGDLEFRWSLDKELIKNPIARLGFKNLKSTDKVADFNDVEGYVDYVMSNPKLKRDAQRGFQIDDDNELKEELLNYYNAAPEVFDNAYYLSSLNTPYETGSLVSSGELAIPRIRAEETLPDDIFVDTDVASPRVWAHEMTHRGFDRIVEYKNQIGAEAFGRKYGQQALATLEQIDKNIGTNEFYTEYFDFVDDTWNYPNLKNMGRDDQEKFLDSNTLKNVKNFQRQGPGVLGKKNPQFGGVGYLIQAAEDILKQVEPPKATPYGHLSFIGRLRKRLGFSEGGMAEQMEMFGYTAEGAKQEADKLATDVNTDLTFKEAATTVGSMLPGVGTAMTVAEIEDELKQENPNYGKIALLGGAEIVGLVPGLGTAAKSGLKAAAKRLGVDKLIKAIDAPKPEDAVKLEAGFTGTNPPTYKERLPNTEVSKVGTILFDKPILEYINSLDYPSKGLKGSDFIKLVEQNPSISTTSFQKNLINPQKRYSSKELNDLFNRNEFDTLAVLERQPRFAKEQRQKNVGFDGGKEVEYFDIPIKARAYPFESLPRDKRLKKFKPKGDLHGYPKSTIVHIRGSIIDPKGDINLAPNVLLDKDKLPGFDTVINDEPFLLVEEIQSDLLQKGYVKPKSTDDAIYNQAKEYFNDDYIAITNYDEVFGGVDQEIRSLVKEIDKENPDLPQMFVDEFNITKGLKGEEIVDKDPLVLDVDESGLSREQILRYGEEVNIFPDADPDSYIDIDDTVEGAVSAAELTDFKFRDYLLEKLQDRGLDREVDPSTLRDFYGNYRSVISDIKEDGIDKFYEDVDVALPPITKNRQAVEEALKVSIAKAASKGVNKIVIPNPTRIALARNRQYDPVRSGDRFGRIYNKDLKAAINDLKENYPVAVYYDELPYNDKKLMTSMRSMLEPLPQEYTSAYAAGDPIDNMGYILDITELVKKYRVESPRQFAEGGTVMNKQMQMAFMNEGGLTDDGMDVDPVSGNDIPAGSMAEEVRDDIPAQLSDGEYVVPADVVRYYGVKFFEDLRERAKMGLAEMEANGRIGGEPVPAGGPMNTEELSPEEMQAIQEMMGMSEGGSVNAYKAQQELLEQPANKAVGNPVMMANGGDVESTILGGKTSSQVGQDFLDQGKAAIDQNYTGIPLGSTIFDPVNTNTGVQQTEVKPFTPITLYNTSGQTRTVNSEEERSKAISEGYTMTLDEYNMYRSKRGGSGGAGGGSGIITPPGQEDESKPWGEGTDWGNEDSIREFVKAAQEGNIEGKSGRFLRGVGFMIAGLPGAGLVGAFQTGQAFETLSDMKAAELIARARGMDPLANEIQDDINSYVKKSGQVVDLIKNVFGISTRKADRHARSLGFEDIEDYEVAFKDKKDFLGGTKIESTKGKDGKVLNVYKAGKDTKRPVLRPHQGQGPSFDDKSLGKDSATSTSAQSYTKPKNDPYAEDRFKNKGGLMTKGKKKK